jgi:two-component system, NarL family, sensor kinase
MGAERRLRRAIGAGWGIHRELLVFVGGAVLALLLVSLGTVLIITQVARSFAVTNAEQTTARLADLVVGPLLDGVLADGELTDNVARRAELDRAVANRLQDGSIISIYVWAADGRVVYSSNAGKIGRRFGPAPEIADVLRDGVAISAVRDGVPDQLRSGSNGQDSRAVEVYVPLRLAGQAPLAFEAYYRYDQVEQATMLALQHLIPLCVGALVLLQLIQIPIVLRLARRVAGHRAERAELLERALSASEGERRQIAADLHDGLIQDLAGAGYALAALTRSVPPERAETAERVGAVVRGAVGSLRRLMVDIYPPDLSGAGLSVAVSDLTAPLREQGVVVSVDVTALPPIDPKAATMLYRVAKEALTNIAKHANAGNVQVSLTAEQADRGPNGDCVLLRVVDDGVGLPADALSHRAEGHLGLQLLIDRIVGLGGQLTVRRAGTQGTIVEARVPVRTAG